MIQLKNPELVKSVTVVLLASLVVVLIGFYFIWSDVNEAGRECDCPVVQQMETNSDQALTPGESILSSPFLILFYRATLSVTVLFIYILGVVRPALAKIATVSGTESES